MSQKIPITVARGDGIGPEIMDAVLRILHVAEAPIDPEFIEIGKSVYERGNTAGIEADAWESIRRTRILLKAPITTPQGGGYKSLNVTIRKSLGLFANVRPVRSYNPYVDTHHPDLDLVIVRENEEDLYAGIEHRQTQDVTQCLKLITRPGSERVIRYAFQYARTYGRRKVTCMIKDNIMKVTDGLFHQVFDEIAAEYPDIESQQQIIDIGTARVATEPERYDVIVLPNLYGDILSDVVAEVSGSVGMAGSVNVGKDVAMFEAIHGSAPDIAGKNIANPSGLLNAAVLMLVHIGRQTIAERIHDAWLRTLEDGIHTPEIYREGHSDHVVGTREFAQAVAERIGHKPNRLTGWHIDPDRDVRISIPDYRRPRAQKTLVGADLFVDWAQGADGNDRADGNRRIADASDADAIGRVTGPGSGAHAIARAAGPQTIGRALDALAGNNLRLKMITNRGVKVYPEGFPETFLTDHWRCRFVHADSPGGDGTGAYLPVEHWEITALMDRLNREGFEVIKTENLYLFDGEKGFSLGQGE